jgi:DNA processing protein
MGDADYPAPFYNVSKPPKTLYVIGAKDVLKQAEELGLAVVGARKATPYGLGAAKRFARLAASRGAVIVSGGARGCDSAAHRAALAESASTVVVLGGGCDCPYPSENTPFFQQIIDAGGAVVSENPWDFEPLPYTFRERNRLIAGLAKATLIVEAGLPSGTFSTADHALEQGKDLLVVPGAITSAYSRGANRLIYQGAHPVVDDETFLDQLFSIYSILCTPADARGGLQPKNKNKQKRRRQEDFLMEALMAEPMSMQQMLEMAKRCCGNDEPIAWLSMWLARQTREGKIAQYGNGMYGPVVNG